MGLLKAQRWMGFIAFLHVGNKYHQQQAFMRVTSAVQEVESIDWLKLKCTLVQERCLADVNRCREAQNNKSIYYFYVQVEMKRDLSVLLLLSDLVALKGFCSFLSLNH